MNQPTQEFHAIADAVLADLLAADPVAATWLGDHAHDSELPDLTDTAVNARAGRLDDHLTALDAVDDVELDVADFVDLEILRSALTKAVFDDTELREQTWNPMAWNPGTSLHLLLSRDFAPLGDRLTSAVGRLGEIPRFLADARVTLLEMPLIHVDVYRLLEAGNAAAYLDDLDLDSAREDGLTVIEWGGAESARLSDDRLEITIDRSNEERVVTISAVGPRWDGVEL